MQISLDDGKTWQEVASLRVIKEFDPVVDADEETVQAELHFDFASVHLITQVYVNNVCERTTSESYTVMGDRLINND